MLLALLNGAELPWSAGKSAAECLQLKRNADIHQLAADLGCPPVSRVLVWYALHCTVGSAYLDH